MNFERLKKFIDLAKETGATELKYDSGKEKYSVSFKQDIQQTEVNKQLATPIEEPCGQWTLELCPDLGVEL